MKGDDDAGQERGGGLDDFEMEDEENQAETVVGSSVDGDDDDDDESSLPPWPQSYRQTMDMYTSVTPPTINLLTGSSFTGRSSSFLSSIYRRSQVGEQDSSLCKPLVSERSIDYSVVKSSISSYSKLSICSELPPVQEECSFGQAVLNAINIICGIGLLTTPFAVREGGWSVLLLLLFFAIICCYTGILLKRCLQNCPGLHTYPDIGQAAFGTTGRIVIAIMLYMQLYASAVEFVIIMSDNCSSLFPDAYLIFSGVYFNSHQIFAIGSTLMVLPTVWLRNLSLLSYLSAGGVIASLLVVLCLLWVGVVDQVGFHPSGTAFNVTNIPVSVGLIGFCFAGHSVYPNIYSSMKEPAQFSWVLVISYVICWFMYTGVAICGFLMFGDLVDSQFTLNMPQDFVASKVALYTTVFSPMTKYALTMAPVALSIEELLPQTRQRSHGMSMLIRTVLVVSTLVVGMSIPFFGSLMALVGSFLAMFVGVIFPCICYLRILSGRLTSLQIAACIFTMVMGFASAFIGTYSAVTRIVSDMS